MRRVKFVERVGQVWKGGKGKYTRNSENGPMKCFNWVKCAHAKNDSRAAGTSAVNDSRKSGGAFASGEGAFGNNGAPRVGKMALKDTLAEIARVPVATNT